VFYPFSDSHEPLHLVVKSFDAGVNPGRIDPEQLLGLSLMKVGIFLFDTLGEVSCHVRSPITLRPPCCEETQANHMEREYKGQPRNPANFKLRIWHPPREHTPTTRSRDEYLPKVQTRSKQLLVLAAMFWIGIIM
jgi:hypothetical protein